MPFYISLMIFGSELMKNKDSLGKYSWISGFVFSIGVIGCMFSNLNYKERIERLENKVKKLEEKDKKI